MSLPDLSALTLDVGMPGSKRKARPDPDSDTPEADDKEELTWADIELLAFDKHPHLDFVKRVKAMCNEQRQSDNAAKPEAEQLRADKVKLCKDEDSDYQTLLEEELLKVPTEPVTPYSEKNDPPTLFHKMAWSGRMSADGVPYGPGQLWRIGDVTQSPLLKNPSKKGEAAWAIEHQEFIQQDQSYGEAYHFKGTLDKQGRPTGKGTLKLFWADLLDPAEWSTRWFNKRDKSKWFPPPYVQELAHFLTFEGEFVEGYAVEGKYTHLKPSDFKFKTRDRTVKNGDWRLIGYETDYLRSSIINRDLRASEDKSMNFYVTSKTAVPAGAGSDVPLPYYRDITSIQLAERRDVAEMKTEGNDSIKARGGVRLSVRGRVRIERVGKERQPNLDQRLVLDMVVRDMAVGSSAPMLVLYNSANMLQVLHKRGEEWEEAAYAVNYGVVSNSYVIGGQVWTQRSARIEGEPFEDGFSADMTIGAGMYGYGESAGQPATKKTTKGCFWDDKLEGPGMQESGNVRTSGSRVYRNGNPVGVYGKGGKNPNLPEVLHNELPDYVELSHDVAKPVLKMFQTIDPTQLGTGADMQWYSNWARSLRPLAIYSISNRERIEQYNERRANWRRDMCPVPLGKVCARTENPFEEYSEWLGLDKEINEKFVFHGASLEACKGIMQNGFRAPTKPGLYGMGNYFADDVTKCNQYSFPLTAKEAQDYLFVKKNRDGTTAQDVMGSSWFGRDDGLFDLRDTTSFPSMKPKNRGQTEFVQGQYTSIYPMLLCRVVLGCAATVSLNSFQNNMTSDFKHELFDPDRDVRTNQYINGYRYGNASRAWGSKDLKTKAWNSIVTSYRSINPSTLQKYRFREFIMYDNTLILPTHLIFYVRHNAIDPGALATAYALGKEPEIDEGDPLYCKEE